eukprot:49736-Chlamydomonas_euryale.AAC.8
MKHCWIGSASPDQDAQEPGRGAWISLSRAEFSTKFAQPNLYFILILSLGDIISFIPLWLIPRPEVWTQDQVDAYALTTDWPPLMERAHSEPPLVARQSRCVFNVSEPVFGRLLDREAPARGARSVDCEG